MAIWLIMNEEEKEWIETENEGTEYKVIPRLVDNPDHPFYNHWAAPARVTQGLYRDYWQDRLDGMLKNDTTDGALFLPPEF